MTTLNLRELLQFYDGPGGAGHSNAMNALVGEELAVALLVRQLGASGYHDVAPLDEPCTQGTAKGPRLDKWVRALGPQGGVLFQVEIKNWCAHSLGGRQLPVDADDPVFDSVLAKHATWMWQRYWNETTMAPRDEPLQKVLEKTARPARYPTETIIPLACVWDLLHPEGRLDPWFEVRASGEFARLRWFSMSAYVRGLLKAGVSELEVALPMFEERMGWAARMFRRP